MYMRILISRVGSANRYRWILVSVAIAVTFLAFLPVPRQSLALAQSCDELIDSYRVATSRQMCRYINNNYACYANRVAEGAPAGTQVDFRFSEPRHRQYITRFSTINTHSQEGAVLMLLKAGIQRSTKLILFGDSLLSPQSESSFRLRVTNSQPLCESTPSGLVAHTPTGEQSLIEVNGVNVLLGSTAYITMEGSEQIAYYSDAGSDWEIYTRDSAGGQVRQLTNNTVDDLHATWSPDGRQIVFQSNRDGDYEIYVMNEDGTGLRQLTFNSSYDSHPNWSPDGRFVAFDSNADGDREIYTVSLLDGSVHKVTSNNVNDRWPVWSPDGSRFALYSDQDGDYDIYIMSVDGSQRQKLTANRADDRYPVWSPDGSRIAFASNMDGDWEIYVMNTNGAALRQLTHNSGAADWGPTWSLDGTEIGFASTRDGDNELYVMDADGSNARQISFNNDSDELPIWQPAAFRSDEKMTVTNMEGRVTVSIPRLGVSQAVPVGRLVAIPMSDGLPLSISDPIASPYFNSPVARWLQTTGLPRVVNPNEDQAPGVPRCGGSIEYGSVVVESISTPGQECLYTFFGNTGDLVNVRMVSFASSTSPGAVLTSLDPWLDLRGPSEDLVAYNDDDGDSQNSRIQEFRLPQSGQYTIVARSYENDSAGMFQLRLSSGRIIE